MKRSITLSAALGLCALCLTVQANTDRAYFSALDQALYRAVEEGELAVVEALIAKDADVNAKLPGDGSPLIAAAREGHVEMVHTLLTAGADPNAAVSGDGNPLIMAAREGHAEVVEILLAAGSEIDAVVPGDETALIQAAWNGRYEAVEMLLNTGADPNLAVPVEGNPWRPREIRSPLAMARKGGHRQVVDLLMAYGAEDK